MAQFLYDVIIYHSNSSDGSCGYWVARKYLNENNKEYQAIAMHAIENLPLSIDECKNKRILFINVCPNFEYIQMLSKIANDITILDHHESTISVIDSIRDSDILNVRFEFNIKLAGCQLVWKHFYSNQLSTPWFLDYIADRELWKFELENSKEINAALRHKKLINIESMDVIVSYNIDEIQTLVRLGETILNIADKVIYSAIHECVEGTFLVGDIKYNVWFGTIDRNICSYFGDKMMEKVMSNGKLPDFVVIYNYQLKTGMWLISLHRSNDGPDLSIISKYFGGKGHKNAAEFEHKNPFDTIFNSKSI